MKQSLNGVLLTGLLLWLVQLDFFNLLSYTLPSHSSH